MPTKTPLKSVPFQPLCRRLFTGKRSGKISTDGENREQGAKLADRVAPQHGRVFVFERRLHDLRQHVQPGDPVVALKHRRPTRAEHAMALGDDLCGRRPRIGPRHARRRSRTRRRQTAAIRRRRPPLLPRPCCVQILARQRHGAGAKDRRPSTRAPPRANRTTSTPAPQPTSNTARPRQAVEVDEPKQMVQLLEVVRVEIGEEPGRARRDAGEMSRS